MHYQIRINGGWVLTPSKAQPRRFFSITAARRVFREVCTEYGPGAVVALVHFSELGSATLVEKKVVPAPPIALGRLDDRSGYRLTDPIGHA